jgi:hypothetical protein
MLSDCRYSTTMPGSIFSGAITLMLLLVVPTWEQG